MANIYTIKSYWNLCDDSGNYSSIRRHLRLLLHGTILNRKIQRMTSIGIAVDLGRITCASLAIRPPRRTYSGSWWLAAFVLVVRGSFHLLLEADVPEERENDRVDLFRSLFRRDVTNAGHHDDVAQIAEIRSE